MKSKDIIKNNLKLFTDIFKTSPVLFANVYGSVAIDQAHLFSDLDIGIYVPKLSIREKMDLEMSLSLTIDKQLKGMFQSDVRVMNDLPFAVTGQILKEGILIYCRDDEARIDYETSTRMAYFDFLPVIQHYQHMYLEQIQ
ncbi:MAG: hypothetical protein GXP53_14500 [Deltaproteobacteria bacterium]|nr:hypothetical protein [Deltaproteobacteria bacterium]